MSELFCIHCGRPLSPSAPRCPGCGGTVAPLPDDTTIEVLDGTEMIADLVAAQRVERVRRQLRLAPSDAVIVITRGQSAGWWYKLEADALTLGRDASADVLLDDVSVSRHHAEIRRGPSGYVLVDAGSLNGTYVNRSTVQRANLVDGDEIQIGLFKLLFLVGGEHRTSPGHGVKDRP